MSLTDDLLEQAGHLAGRDPTRPKQASLRRAVSTAYYALFHLLTQEGAASLVPGRDFRSLVARAYAHGDMKSVCQGYAGRARLPEPIGRLVGVVPDDLKLVAEVFIDLQQERHDADYNTTATYTRLEVRDLVALTANAFQSWQRVRAQPVARIFLAHLLLGNKFSR